jgi:hypothetical protein
MSYGATTATDMPRSATHSAILTGAIAIRASRKGFELGGAVRIKPIAACRDTIG